MIKILLNAEWVKLREKVDLIGSKIDSHTSIKPDQQMCQYLIAGEDHRFYYHFGVDPIALCRAAWKSVFCGSRQGGSTIAMQLVRTITGRYEKTWQRKLREIILAVRLTHYLDRDQLPILYLSIAYYGWKMHNLYQACLRLQIDPVSITQMDAAKLVARLKYPESRNYSIERLQKTQCRAEHLIRLRNTYENSIINAERQKWSHSESQHH